MVCGYKIYKNKKNKIKVLTNHYYKCLRERLHVLFVLFLFFSFFWNVVVVDVRITYCVVS